MSIVDVAKEYATVINSIVLIVLLLKHLTDLRKQKLEYEKLERELQQLRARDEAERSEVLKATAEDIQRYVIGPLAQELQERDQKLGKMHLEIVERIAESRHLAQSLEREFHHDRERQLRELFDHMARSLEQQLVAHQELLDRNMEMQSMANRELLERQFVANQELLERQLMANQRLIEEWQHGSGEKPNKTIDGDEE